VTDPISEELKFAWPPSAEDRDDSVEILKDTLRLLEERDQDHEVRPVLVLTALGMAAMAGLETGIRVDPADPDRPVAYVELPTGQVSWRMPAHQRPYDGHTTAEKYARIKAYVGQPASPLRGVDEGVDQGARDGLGQ
jgi:hypothetical protein